MTKFARWLIQGGAAFAFLALPILVVGAVESFVFVWARYLTFGLLGFAIPACVAAVMLRPWDEGGQYKDYRDALFWSGATSAATVLAYWLLPSTYLIGVWLIGSVIVEESIRHNRRYT